MPPVIPEEEYESDIEPEDNDNNDDDDNDIYDNDIFEELAEFIEAIDESSLNEINVNNVKDFVENKANILENQTPER